MRRPDIRAIFLFQEPLLCTLLLCSGVRILKKIHPNVRFNISAGGAGKGITDVLTNMVDIGLVSRDLHPQEVAKGAWPIHVAKDAVLGTVNSNHPNISLIKTRGFTQKELADLFVHKKI